MWIYIAQLSQSLLCAKHGVRCLFSLTPVSHATVSLYSVEGFPWYLAQKVIMQMGIAEKVVRVRGQRSRSFLMILCKLYCYNSCLYSPEGAISCVQMCKCCNGTGIHFSGMASRLTCFNQLASCLIYARALLEYVIFITWLRSVIKMLPSVKFAEDKVLTFLIILRWKC